MRANPVLVTEGNFKLTIRDISQIIEKLLGSQEVLALKSLSTQGKLLMCAAVLMFSRPAKSKAKNYVPSVTYDQVTYFNVKNSDLFLASSKLCTDM